MSKIIEFHFHLLPHRMRISVGFTLSWGSNLIIMPAQQWQIPLAQTSWLLRQLLFLLLISPPNSSSGRDLKFQYCARGSNPVYIWFTLVSINLKTSNCQDKISIFTLWLVEWKTCFYVFCCTNDLVKHEIHHDHS